MGRQTDTKWSSERMRIKDRLRTFMEVHGVTHEEMASRVSTPYGTFKKWMMTKDTQPPGCMLTLMNILERSEEARKIVGLPAKGAKH